MADNPGPGVIFVRIAAAVPVSDISRALGFYQDILGMSVTFTNGDPTGFVIRHPTSPPPTSPEPRNPGTHQAANPPARHHPRTHQSQE